MLIYLLLLSPAIPQQEGIVFCSNYNHFVLGVGRLSNFGGLGFALARCSILAGARSAILPSDGFQELQNALVSIWVLANKAVLVPAQTDHKNRLCQCASIEIWSGVPNILLKDHLSLVLLACRGTVAFVPFLWPIPQCTVCDRINVLPLFNGLLPCPRSSS